MFTENELVVEIGKLQKFAMRLTRNKSNADDLVQSTCLRALEKSDYFQDGSNLFSWTSKIMYNLFVSDYRRRMKFESQYDPDIHLEKQSVRPEQDITMEVADTERAMSRLNESYRNIIILTCVEDRDYKEVSAILGVPLGTVRSRLSRARTQLKILMDDPPGRAINANMPVVPAYIASNALQHKA